MENKLSVAVHSQVQKMLVGRLKISHRDLSSDPDTSVREYAFDNDDGGLEFGVKDFHVESPVSWHVCQWDYKGKFVMLKGTAEGFIEIVDAGSLAY